MNKRKQIILLSALVLMLFAVNYSWIDGYFTQAFENFNREDFTVKRVIDGDTIVVGEDLHVRLFGINTPEKGEKYYGEAKQFVDNSIFNKTIFLESLGKDKYQRELGIVFFNDENFNVQLVENGFANVYILEDSRYETELREAWEKCIQNEKNLCEKSVDECAKCIELKGLNIEKQEAVFENKCNFECDMTGWEIKDEGRKKFVFPNFVLEKGEEAKIIVGNYSNSNNILYWSNEDYVWTETGDTLFLRDKGGKLVLYKSY